MSLLLLGLTARLTKKETPLFRLVAASALGAAYSLVILLDELPAYVLVPSRLVASLAMMLVAFRFSRAMQLLKATLVFYFSSMIFLGVIIALCYLFRAEAIAINNSVIYFNISAPALIACAAAAYLISCLVVRMYNRSLGRRELYTLCVTNNDKTVTMLAIMDTGNRLREPFSDAPVIVARRSRLEDIVGASEQRIIPASTIAGDSVLLAFKPDKLVLRSSKSHEVLENAYIALSDNITDESYSAILNPDIFSI